MAIGEKCAGYLRMFLAFIGCIFLLAGIGLQFFAAGNLYGIRCMSAVTILARQLSIARGIVLQIEFDVLCCNSRRTVLSHWGVEAPR